MTPRILLALGGVVVLACGGKTVGPGEDADGGTSSHDSGGSADAPSGQDAPSVTLDAGPPPTQCDTVSSVGGSSSGSCVIQASKSCSDGTMYAADCSCETQTCSCAETLGAGGGSSGGNIPFTGCPTCEPGPALAACGFGP
jgi:hypothetical protein